jgi:hypothetical protein
MNFRSFVTGAAALVTLVTLVPWAAAQSTGSIQGTVYDPAGAAIANAKVVVTNTGTGEIRETASDSSGAYAAPSLVPGTYTVVVSAPGFETASAAKVTLSVGVTVTEDFHLVVGSTSQTVEVAAAAPLVDTTTTGISAVVNQREVQQLPLNGRHFVDLGLIIPGSVTPPQSGFLNLPDPGARVVVVQHGGKPRGHGELYDQRHQPERHGAEPDHFSADDQHSQRVQDGQLDV